MLKKLVITSILVTLMAAGCNKIQTSDNSSSTTALQTPTTNTQNTYTNTKYGYSFHYPSEYQPQTYSSTEAGYDLPSTVAKPDSDPVSINKAGTNTSFEVGVSQSSLSLSEQSIKNEFAVAPESITAVQVSNVKGYRVVFSDSSNIPYVAYFFQKSNGQTFEIKVKKNDSLSDQIFGSFQFIQ